MFILVWLVCYFLRPFYFSQLAAATLAAHTRARAAALARHTPLLKAWTPRGLPPAEREAEKEVCVFVTLMMMVTKHEAFVKTMICFHKENHYDKVWVEQKR